MSWMLYHARRVETFGAVTTDDRVVPISNDGERWRQAHRHPGAVPVRLRSRFNVVVRRGAGDFAILSAYSVRSATIGSMVAARTAGIQDAASAATQSNRVAMVSIRGSHGATP
jgi:hypothetical protein